MHFAMASGMGRVHALRKIRALCCVSMSFTGFYLCYLMPVSRAEQLSAIQVASNLLMNLPLVVSISSTL